MCRLPGICGQEAGLGDSADDGDGGGATAGDIEAHAQVTVAEGRRLELSGLGTGFGAGDFDDGVVESCQSC